MESLIFPNIIIRNGSLKLKISLKKNEILYLETFVLNQLFKSIDNIKLASLIKVSKVTSLQPSSLDCELSSLHIVEISYTMSQIK